MLSATRGSLACILTQAGSLERSIGFAFGGVPFKTTFPLMTPPSAPAAASIGTQKLTTHTTKQHLASRIPLHPPCEGFEKESGGTCEPRKSRPGLARLFSAPSKKSMQPSGLPVGKIAAGV